MNRNGAREAVVLVHGLAGSSRWWHRLVPLLQDRLEVHCVDLPRDYTLATAPELLLRRLDELELGRPHLVGHSLGGLVVARVAARAPHRVHGLVLIAPAGIGLRSSLVAHSLPLARALAGLRPQLAAAVTANALRTGPRRLIRTSRDLLADAALPGELRAVRAPTLLVWGERDSLVPARVAKQFLAELPHGRLHVVPRAGHVPMDEAPEEVAGAILGHLTR
jgi:pimeloyl-ACP methyl ester carboxylesterase